MSQAVGIIMGANIGTRITSWMLSLTGIEGSTIWLKLHKPIALNIAEHMGLLYAIRPSGEYLYSFEGQRVIE